MLNQLIENVPAHSRVLVGALGQPLCAVDPVRVCFMIDGLTRAGTETQLLALIHNLDRRRVRPYLCLLDGTDDQSRSLEPKDCPVFRLGLRGLARPRTFIQAARLAEFLRAERIEILQLYFLDTTYFGTVVGRLAGVPYVVRTRNNVNHWMTPLHRHLGRIWNHLVDVTVANCEPARQAVLSDEAPDPASVVVLENGVDLARFEGIAAGSGRGTRRVGLVGNLRPVKGIDALVRAAAHIVEEFPDAVFEVAGEGESRPELEALIAELGLGDRFRLPGSTADVPAFLAGLEVAVLSSRAEGMSNAILEYMAAGRPVVATAVGGNVHLLEQDRTGLLVPPEYPNALAEAILRLLRDPELAASMACAAQARVREHYSREAMVRRFEDFFLALARRSAHAS
jgi:glycosyltransferase involved in cell wall biosynthesis